MKLYFVRHGESEANAARIVQTSESPLTKSGLKQAQFVAHRFQNIPIDVIFSSPYIRAKQTAKIISKTIQKDIVYDENLREIKRPSELEGKSIFDPEVAKIKQLLQEHWSDRQWHYSDEDNFYDLVDRAKSFITMIRQRQENNILVVSHGLILRVIVGVMAFEDNFDPKIFSYWSDFLHTKNTGITICEYKREKWGLLVWNDHAHLGD